MLNQKYIKKIILTVLAITSISTNTSASIDITKPFLFLAKLIAQNANTSEYLTDIHTDIDNLKIGFEILNFDKKSSLKNNKLNEQHYILTNILNGKIISKYPIKIASHNLSGSGHIEGDNIIIRADSFNFTGTIKCNGSCIIIAKNYFDENMFTKAGSGKFIFKIIQ